MIFVVASLVASFTSSQARDAVPGSITYGG